MDLRFLCLVFLLCATHHAPYAEYHEGNAEELTHIEGHTHLEVALYLLEELHEEAEGKDGGKAISEEEACTDLAGHTTIEIPAYESEEGVGKRLVELCRMAWQQVYLCEDESEVSSCGATYNL